MEQITMKVILKQATKISPHLVMAKIHFNRTFAVRTALKTHHEFNIRMQKLCSGFIQAGNNK